MTAAATVTVQKAAERLSVSAWIVYELIKTGELAVADSYVSGRRHRRIREDSLVELIKRNTLAKSA